MDELEQAEEDLRRFKAGWQEPYSYTQEVANRMMQLEINRRNDDFKEREG